jgi:glutamine synthetase
VAFRIINHDAHATRVEHRLAGADVNPYLSMAAIIASGRFGMQFNTGTITLCDGNAYRADAPSVPKSVSDAAGHARRSTALSKVMSRELIEAVCKLYLFEADLAELEVPDTETARYFAWA